MAFTFKKEKAETGLAGVANPYPNTQIKRSGKVVGVIRSPSRFSSNTGWQVGVAVKASGASCGWKWVFFKHESVSEQGAREWLRMVENKILEQFELHELDD